MKRRVGAIVLAALALVMFASKLAETGVDVGGLDLFAPAATVSVAWWPLADRSPGRALWLASAAGGLALAVGGGLLFNSALIEPSVISTRTRGARSRTSRRRSR